MQAIHADHLTKRFGPLAAVDELSLDVAEGEIFGLVGPDGAGKTTTMRLLTSIMEPTGGEAWVAGFHTVREAERIKENIGYMSQRFGLYPDLTVMENIDFYADIYNEPRRGRKEKVDRLLAFSNLAPFKKRLAGNLSGGMKQKLGLACALIHTPKVLFLDEPTNGVDPVSRRDFWRILYQLLREKVTIFISTAYLDEAERCNRVGLIHRGRLIAYGTPHEVKQLMRGAILEIRTDEPRRAVAVLRRRLPAASVGLFGDRIHVVSVQPDRDATDANTVLAEAGLVVTAIQPIEPSLEDVFVSVLAEKGGSMSSDAEGGLSRSRQPSPPAPLPKGEGTDGAATLPKGGVVYGAALLPKGQGRLGSNDYAVTVDKLEKRFDAFVAVDCVSFQVGKGEIFGFLGPNGAGKSTTIRMLCGILAPSGGTGTVAGFDIRKQSEQIKANIGYMSQKFSLYQDLTVEENIDFYSGIYCIPADQKRERKEWVVEMSGLAEHRHSSTAILSGGWKQRLALGCAILHRPPIVFLDEPTSGVDPISRRQFWELIYELSGQGVTIFVTTHYMDEAEYCDRLGLIYRGELIALDTPHTLKTKMMNEDVIEVLCERPESAMLQMAELSSVKEVALFGKGLHLVTEDGRLAAAEVRQLLSERGFGIERIEKITPSLEDVFVSLIEARDRAEQPQQEVQR